jgi:hypothetical protein
MTVFFMLALPVTTVTKLDTILATAPKMKVTKETTMVVTIPTKVVKDSTMHCEKSKTKSHVFYTLFQDCIEQWIFNSSKTPSMADSCTRPGLSYFEQPPDLHESISVAIAADQTNNCFSFTKEDCRGMEPTTMIKQAPHQLMRR